MQMRDLFWFKLDVYRLEIWNIYHQKPKDMFKRKINVFFYFYAQLLFLLNFAHLMPFARDSS